MRRHVEPAVDVLALEVVLAHERRDVDELAGLGEIAHETGLGEVDEVRDIAGVDPGRDCRLELLRAFVLDVDSGRLFESLDVFVELHLVGSGEGAEGGHGGSLELAREGVGKLLRHFGCPGESASKR